MKARIIVALMFVAIVSISTSKAGDKGGNGLTGGHTGNGLSGGEVGNGLTGGSGTSGLVNINEGTEHGNGIVSVGGGNVGG
jgi:hypothetical protein